jgi:hypothetical protein
LRLAIAAGLSVLSLIFGFRGRGHHLAQAALALRAPRPLPVDDADRDGLSDAEEAALAARFAPAVILAPGERHRPASIDWLLARVGDRVGRGSAPTLASRLEGSDDRFPDEVRAGSGDPRDWVTYVHVYPRVDGRIGLQYWFFYPYNAAPLFFDHEGDWEHVTVEVDRDGTPRAVAFAQHGNNSPGQVLPWSAVRKSGDHPIVLSARGTHASYPDQAGVAWFDHASQCTAVDGCADPVWRTWAAGGLVNVGERGAVRGASATLAEALAYDGRWGGEGHFLRSRDAPRGPLQQGCFASGGF